LHRLRELDLDTTCTTRGLGQTPLSRPIAEKYKTIGQLEPKMIWTFAHADGEKLQLLLALAVVLVDSLTRLDSREI